MQYQGLHSEHLENKGKPTLLMLHGWGHSIEMLRDLSNALKADFDIHLIDLPGHGKSPVPEKIWGMDEFADCIKEYLHSKKLETAIMLGHSFGGKTSMKLAIKKPELVEALILINCSGITRRRTPKQQLRIKSIGYLRTLVKTLDKIPFLNLDLFREWFVPKFASPDYLNAGPIRATFVKTLHEDLSEKLPTIDCPTMLLWSRHDPETPLEMGERFHKLIANSKLTVLESKEHVPFLGVGAHKCAYLVKQFTKETQTTQKLSQTA